MSRAILENFKNRLRAAFDSVPRTVSEKDTLEAALEVAEEWEMRRDELAEEEKEEG